MKSNNPHLAGGELFEPAITSKPVFFPMLQVPQHLAHHVPHVPRVTPDSQATHQGLSRWPWDEMIPATGW